MKVRSVIAAGLTVPVAMVSIAVAGLGLTVFIAGCGGAIAAESLRKAIDAKTSVQGW